jgi:hypothetical protein
MFDTYYIKHKKYVEQIREDIDDAEAVLSKTGDINLKSFDLHDELNDKLWDKEQNLKPGIREQLMQIAQDFYDTLDISEISEDGDPDERPDPTFQKYIKDVFLVGSLASFNYSSYADVDLHLLMDEEKLVGKNKLALNILKKYFTECKNDWNLKHSDLTIEGYDCELYVQDMKEENASNGVYSLFNDEWVKSPEALDTKNFDKSWIEKKALDYIEQIDSLEEVIQTNSDLELVQKAKDELKKIKDKIVQGRRDSLAAGQGEMNKYNILFKILRRSGHIAKINDLTVKAYDMINSFNDKNNLKNEGNNMKNKEEFVENFINNAFGKDDNGNDIDWEGNVVSLKESETEAIAEFERMYGPNAGKALRAYLNKRSRKSAEEVLASDDEFEKFSNWAYKHLGIDVYAKFARYDTGSFYKRTSDLAKDPEQRADKRLSTKPGDDTRYSYEVSDDDGGFDRDDTINWDKDYPDNPDESIIVRSDDDLDYVGESIEVVEDDEKPADDQEKTLPMLILGKVDDNSTVIIVTEEPSDAANKILSKYNDLAKEEYKKNNNNSEEGFQDLTWQKYSKSEINYWFFIAPKKLEDIRAELESAYGKTFKITVQESNVVETDQNQQTQPQGNEQTNAPVDNTQQNNNQPAPQNNANQQQTPPANGQAQPAPEQQDQNQQTQTTEATAKIVGATWDEFLKNIEEQTVYKVDSAFKRHANQWIELIGKDGQIYDAEVTKYSDGEFELLYTNIHPVPNEESKKKAPINESYADDAIENIKGVIRKYFEIDPETEEPNPEFDDSFTAQDAIDEIVDILY